MTPHEADPTGGTTPQETTPRSISITSINRSLAANRPRRALGTMVMAGLATLVAVVALTHHPDAAAIERQQSARACLQWHAGAGTVVSRLVRSTSDADLQLATDTVDQMRRARRNCETGHIAQACQDYHAVTTGLAGHALASEWSGCGRFAQSHSN